MVRLCPFSWNVVYLPVLLQRVKIPLVLKNNLYQVISYTQNVMLCISYTQNVMLCKKAKEKIDFYTPY